MQNFETVSVFIGQFQIAGGRFRELSSRCFYLLRLSLSRLRI